MKNYLLPILALAVFIITSCSAVLVKDKGSAASVSAVLIPSTPTPIPSYNPTPSPAPTPTPAPVGTVRNVANSSQWTTAITAAVSGDVINITANIGTALSIKDKTYSASNPLRIKASAPQGISLYSMEIRNCVGVTLEGFKLGPSNAGTLVKVDKSTNVLVTRNYFDHHNISVSQASIVISDLSSNVDILNNTFVDKDYVMQGGSYIKVSYTNLNFPTYINIKNNYFKNIVPFPVGDSFDGDSDRECIIIGSTGTNITPCYSVVENNLFEDCDGEGELISLKCSNNIVRYNTFVNCLGGVSVRTGANNDIYGNFFLCNPSNKNAYQYDTAGIRTYGSNHKIYNNYFEGLKGKNFTAPICIDGGDTTDPLASGGHVRSKDCEITNNTIVNCDYGVEIGYYCTKYNNTIYPEGCKFSNNIIYNTKLGNMFVVSPGMPSSNVTFEGNIGYGSTVGYTFNADQLSEIDPKLNWTGDFFRLTSDSPAIDFAKGSYPYVTTDVEGQTKSVNDSGADEYSTASVTKAPLVSANVGCYAP